MHYHFCFLTITIIIYKAPKRPRKVYQYMNVTQSWVLSKRACGVRSSRILREEEEEEVTMRRGTFHARPQHQWPLRPAKGSPLAVDWGKNLIKTKVPRGFCEKKKNEPDRINPPTCMMAFKAGQRLSSCIKEVNIYLSHHWCCLTHIRFSRGRGARSQSQAEAEVRVTVQSRLRLWRCHKCDCEKNYNDVTSVTITKY